MLTECPNTGRPPTIKTADGEGIRLFIAGILEKRLKPEKGLLLIIDESHRYIEHGRNDPIIQIFREGRHYNICVWVTSHRVQDLPPTILTCAEAKCAGFSKKSADIKWWAEEGIPVPKERFIFNIDTDDEEFKVFVTPGGITSERRSA